MTLPLRGGGIAAVRLQEFLQMVAQRLPASGILPRGIRHNAVNFADNSLPQRGADEIRDRERAVIVDPPHVVMCIDVYQDAVLESSVAPKEIGAIVILHQVNLLYRIDSDPGGAEV